MLTNLAGIFQYYTTQLANLSGQIFQVFRPNLNQMDQTPVFIQNLSMKVEVSGDKFAAPRMNNIEYYAVFADRYSYQPGDILITTDPSSTTPPVTVLQYSPLEESMAMRTSLVGDIVYSYPNKTEIPLYTNIRYQWLEPATAGANLGSLLNGATSHQDRRIAVYTRPGLRPDMALDTNGNVYDITGLRFIETSGTVRTVWIVKLLIQINSITQLVLEQEDGA